MTSAPAPLGLFDYERLPPSGCRSSPTTTSPGGAHDELTLRENRAAFERVALRPRVLVDVSERDRPTELVGRRRETRLLAAP